MGRPSKKIETERKTTGAPENELANTVNATSAEAGNAPDIPARVIELMRLYPQYEEFWVTPQGFVHPVDTPKYLTKNATLFKNKYYNK